MIFERREEFEREVARKEAAELQRKQLELKFKQLNAYPRYGKSMCIVFNQEYFDNDNKRRYGSQYDVKAIRKTFDYLGFDVTIYQDLYYDDIMRKARQTA